MYLDSSLAFRKLGKNKYAYTFGPPYVSKVYIVTYQEKRELKLYLDRFMREVMCIFPASSSCAVIRHPIIIFCVCVFLTMLRWINCRKKVKKILGSRKKEVCERLTFGDYLVLLSDYYSWKDIAYTFMASTVLFVLIGPLYMEYKNSDYRLVIHGGLMALLFLNIMLFPLMIKISYLKNKSKKLKEQIILPQQMPN